MLFLGFSLAPSLGILW
uniref:Uncharacterized protein n=1 Tax=Arundo donax TaxID=35708 RepID=A0A0A9H294_ARUDO